MVRKRMETAIRDSCNFYFNTVGYYLGQNEDGEYVGDMSSYSINTRRCTAFDSTSGIEISEMDPADRYRRPDPCCHGTE